MRSPDNLPIAMSELHRNDMRNALSYFDITGIFNQHGTAEDAQASAAQVEPDSIVYVEGFSTSTIATKTIYDHLSILAEIRRKTGKSEHYLALKHMLLESVRDCQTKLEAFPPENPRDFSAHCLEEIRLLVEKDCDVLLADYYHYSSDNPQIAEGAAFSSNFVEKSTDAYFSSPFSDVRVGDGVGKHVIRLAKTLNNYTVSNDTREFYSSIRIGADALQIADAPEWLPNIHRNASGKVRTYVIYGTAHAKSLTRQLEQMGAAINPVIVNAIPENEYLEPYDTFTANRRRRLAFASLKDIMPLTADSDLIDALYVGLEELNDDKERAFAFGANCLKISLRRDTDPDGAWVELRQLIRPYVDTTVDLDSVL